MPTVNDAVTEYLINQTAQGAADATLKWYGSILSAFARRFESVALESLDAATVRRYLVELRESGLYEAAPQKPQQDGKKSRATVKGHTIALKAWAGWCAREYGIQDPTANIRAPKRDTPQPRAVSPSDVVKLLTACDPETFAGQRDALILALLYDSGMRSGALLGITLDNIDYGMRRIVITSKGNKRQSAPYTTYTARLMSRYLQARDALQVGHERLIISANTGEPLTASGLNQALKRLKKRSGVSGRVNPHSFRHGFAREYLRQGGDVITLARLLGHSDVNTTAAYYAVFDDDELAMMHNKYSPIRGLNLSSV